MGMEWQWLSEVGVRAGCLYVAISDNNCYNNNLDNYRNDDDYKTSNNDCKTSEYPRNYGDVNVDGKVDIADAIFLNKYLAGQIALSVAGTLNADCNASGDLDDADTTVLMAYVLMKITDLPYIQE